MTIDLLAEVREEGKSTSRTFAAELIGYLDLPDIQDADERVLSDGGRTASEGKLPICAFVIGVRKPEGIWRWVVEPVIEDGRAVLRPGGKRNWHALDDAGIARLVKQVNAWYGAREEEPKANHEK